MCSASKQYALGKVPVVAEESEALRVEIPLTFTEEDTGVHQTGRKTKPHKRIVHSLVRLA